MRISAYAKINWCLNILGRRADGYHDMDTLMQSISLCDDLIIEPADDITLACNAPGVPDGKDNLVFQAAYRLRDRFSVEKGARMRLIKRIPPMAGLGGGSADAAAALYGLSRFWGLTPSPGELHDLAAGLGSDVPFCLDGGLQRATGKGDRLQPLLSGGPIALSIIMPDVGLSTREVFARYDEVGGSDDCDIAAAVAALAGDDLIGLGAACANALVAAACGILPDVRRAIDDLRQAGALWARMSGSGAATFGVFPSEREALRACERLSPAWPRCFRAKTMGQGAMRASARPT